MQGREERCQEHNEKTSQCEMNVKRYIATFISEIIFRSPTKAWNKRTGIGVGFSVKEIQIK